MPAIPDRRSTIELVGSEATSLGRFLSGLSVEDWERDSACAEWQVRDVITHLTQAADTWADGLRRAMLGDANPPPGGRTLQPGERGSAATAQRAIEQRQTTTPDALLNAYDQGYRKLQQQLEELRDEDWEKPCFHRRGVLTVHEYVGRRVQELAIHAWDVRSAFDPDYQLSQAASALLADVTHRWLRTSFAPLEGVGNSARFRFDISNPVTRQEDVVIDPGISPSGFEIEPVGEADPDVTFRLDTSSYILLVFGRLRAAGPDQSPRIRLEGSQELAGQFSRWFQGV